MLKKIKMPGKIKIPKKINIPTEIKVPQIPRVGVLYEFKEFLREYRVVGLAIAFVMGTASTVLVQSFVNNIIMPIINPLVAGGEWEKATFTIGPIVIGWGAFLAALLNFVILAFAIFIIAKKVFRMEKKAEKDKSKKK